MPNKHCIANFASVKEKFIVEVDGGYHDYIYADDVTRQQKLEAAGWRVARFTNEDVIENVDNVAIGIARMLGKDPEQRGRKSKAKRR